MDFLKAEMERKRKLLQDKGVMVLNHYQIPYNSLKSFIYSSNHSEQQKIFQTGRLGSQGKRGIPGKTLQFSCKID